MIRSILFFVILICSIPSLALDARSNYAYPIKQNVLCEEENQDLVQTNHYVMDAEQSAAQITNSAQLNNAAQITNSAQIKNAAPSKRARHKVVNRQGEILIYADNFDPNIVTERMPLALQEMLRDIKLKSEKGTPRYSSRVKGNAVRPLLNCGRHQESPYNITCPYYSYDDGSVSEERCVTGCVATALEMVLSYWKHPSELKDTLHGWETEHYTIPDVLPGTKIDWDNILPIYIDGRYNETQAKAVADLTYYLGVGVKMSWTPNSSSASLRRAVDALYDAFDYKTIAYVTRGLYSNTTWNRMLRNELECGRPIVYTGHNYTMGGHCFVVDGVDEEGYYHINWGEENYSCYLDMDYMNPYEDFDDLTEMGMFNGAFSNQTAMFLHPDDFVIDISDSLSIETAYNGVEVEGVTFRREPDRRGYIKTDFTLHNTTNDSLNYTFEVLTYLPTDTAIFKQADYVALSTVNLAPGERKTWPAYCHFSKFGDRILAISPDDETLPFAQSIHIEDGIAPKYVFGEPEVQFVRRKNADGSDNHIARITLDISNDAASGVGSYPFTYCLYEEGADRDVRHFNIVDVYAGKPYHEVIDFQHLEDRHVYTFILRYPWTVQREVTFTYDASSEVVDGIEDVMMVDRDGSGKDRNHDCENIYDLLGRQVLPSGKGIYIKNGKRYVTD